jgi:hypothetical protein
VEQIHLPFESIEQMFKRVFRSLKPRTAAPAFSVQFYPYAGLNSTIRMDAGHRQVRVRLSDLLHQAPAHVQEALAVILISKLYRKRSPDSAESAYRDWTISPAIRQLAKDTRRVRGRKQMRHPRGKVHDLDALFAELNERFFDAGLRKPALGWSPGKSRQMLGHYDSAHDTIVISRVFDQPDVPRYLLEYVLYHEMLHVKYPTEMRRQRRCVHTPAFKAEERLFPRFEEANRVLKNL